MTLRPFHSAIAILLATLLAASLPGCTEGTTTSTDNTVARIAIHSDGRPAAGAVLTARSVDTLLSPDGIPAWKVIASDTADAQGRFRKEVSADSGIVWEIRERPDSPVQRYPEALIVGMGVGGGGIPDTFRLAPSGIATGRLARTAGPLVAGLWIGVPGTSVLAQAGAPDDSGGVAFRLEGLPPGSWPLEVIPVQADPTLAGPTPPVRVEAEKVTDQGSIYYVGGKVPVKGK